MNLDSDNLSDRSRNTQAASLEFLCFNRIVVKLTLVTRRSDLDVSSNFNKQSVEKVTAPQLLILI